LLRQARAIFADNIQEDLVTISQHLRIRMLLSVPLLMVFVAGACTTQTATQPPAAGTAPVADAPDPSTGNDNLASLCAQRASANSAKDFTIGPGDVIQINVPGTDEFRNYQARVSPTGALELPLVGSVQAAGLTEQGLTDELKKHLGEYIRSPDVEVLVAQYQSREVGVAGMVQKPGPYTLVSPSETLLDVMSQAGGTAPTAANQIYFIPGQAGAPLPGHAGLPIRGQAGSQTLTIPPVNAAGAPTGQLSARQDIHVIDLSNPASSKYMSCPARPGDVLIAPATGLVMVQGWVRQPGSFPIAPRMTVLGAVDAAGGAMFSSDAHLLRSNSSGTKVDTPLDLSKIASGKQPDIPVESGDVVAVFGSVIGAVPYAFYTLFTRVTPGIGAFSGIP
jgi:polysaccharide biosynthesis/export protein